MQKEVICALRRIPGLRTVAVDITSNPSVDQAVFATKVLLEQKCSILFTINEWGLDFEGVIPQFLKNNRIVHINWCVDDPFFEEIIHKKKFRKSDNRIDFVSDRDYLKKMSEQGYNAHFLPLGTDISLFYPDNKGFLHDSSFVGSSYFAQVSEFTGKAEDFLSEMIPFLASLICDYRKDTELDIGEKLSAKISTMQIPDNLTFDNAVFISKHLAGYLYRKEIVAALASQFSGFKVYGDQGWLREVDKERIGQVGYHTGLRDVYNSTRVNIDINRVVIKNGFTQRVFDVLACGAFLITNSKPIINDFFETDGEHKEIVTFRNAEELTSLTKYYLAHESERLQIARRGCKKVLAEHTYDHRIKELFMIVSSFV